MNIDKNIIEDVLAILDHITDWSDIVYYEGYSEKESEKLMESLQILRQVYYSKENNIDTIDSRIDQFILITTNDGKCHKFTKDDILSIKEQ